MTHNLAPFPQDMERILAIRLDNIGDVVMTGPALRALRAAYPQAHLTLMASPAGSQVGPLLPWVDEVFPWRAVWQQLGSSQLPDPAAETRLFEQLKEQHFDAAFIFTSFSQSPHPPAYACYMAGIPVRVGESKEFGGALLSHSVPPCSDEVHQVERNLHLVRSVGLPASDPALELHVPEQTFRSTDLLLEAAGLQVGQRYIALAPGASCPARRYDEERFAQAAKILVEQSGLPVVLLGSAREAGKFPALDSLAQRDSSGVFSLIGKTSVPEMAAVLQRARVVIANNSGSMHMAAAFRKPMVILFSGTELFEQWAPATPGAQLIQRAVTCSPCHGFECPYHLECLEIPAEEVAAHALNLLQEAALPSKRNPMEFNQNHE